MHRRFRTPLVAALCLSAVASQRAQSAASPSGHWVGTIQVPGSEMKIEIDLAKNVRGELEGTFSSPAEKIKGLPLTKVMVEGSSVDLSARDDQRLHGVLSADGQTISGDLIVGDQSVPFRLTRAGDPQIPPPARIPAIGRDLEGIWNGIVEGSRSQLHLVLTMTNQPDGSASATIVNVDEGRLKIPVSAITRTDASVTLDLEAISGSYTGVMNKEGTELVGTFRQGERTAPLTFRRAEGKK